MGVGRLGGGGGRGGGRGGLKGDCERQHTPPRCARPAGSVAAFCGGRIASWPPGRGGRPGRRVVGVCAWRPQGASSVTLLLFCFPGCVAPGTIGFACSAFFFSYPHERGTAARRHPSHRSSPFAPLAVGPHGKGAHPPRSRRGARPPSPPTRPQGARAVPTPLRASDVGSRPLPLFTFPPSPLLTPPSHPPAPPRAGVQTPS